MRVLILWFASELARWFNVTFSMLTFVNKVMVMRYVADDRVKPR